MHSFGLRLNVQRFVTVVLAITTASLRSWALAASFELVSVADPGNAADANGMGRVAYGYQIGKSEVTIGEYTHFLNAVANIEDRYQLWNPRMTEDLNVAGITRSGTIGPFTYSAFGSPHKPITYVSWFDAARYVNWLSSGNTEAGAYPLAGATSGTAPARVPGATYALPNEPEWYKAAYYSGSGSYWKYATQETSAPSNDFTFKGNTANVMVNGLYAITQSPILDPNQSYLMDAGSSGTTSHYGTVDQTGNVSEWLGVGASPSQALRGGNWKNDVLQVDSSVIGSRTTASGTSERPTYGFRIVNLWGGTSSTPLPNPLPSDVIAIHVATGTQQLSSSPLPGGRSLTGRVSLLKTGTGAFIIDHRTSHTGMTIIQNGKLELAPGGSLTETMMEPLASGTFSLGGSFATSIAGLSPNLGGLTDIGGGSLTVTAGLEVHDLRTALLAGRGDGTWNGVSGITSSQARSAIMSNVPRTVGWLDNGSGSVTFGFAAPGDTNLDWRVDVEDLSSLISGGKLNTGQSATWAEGDFNYDGIVDLLDIGELISANLYDAGDYNTTPFGAITGVPEPSGRELVGVGLSFAGLMAARRKLGRGSVNAGSA